MAHDTTLSAPIGTGDTIVVVDLALSTYPTASGKLPASCLYVSADATTAPTPVTAANGMYVRPGTAAVFAISATALPLPSGAATAAKQPALGTAGTASADVITIQGVASMTPVKVDGSGVTQPVSGTVTANAGSGTFAISGTVTANAGSGTFAISAAALPLPSGASTSAKQPALGTAGSASADVITIQGVTGMTAVKTDASATTQPVSGTVAATQSGTWTVQPGNTPNTTPWLVSAQATTGGGTSLPYSFLSTAAVQAAAIKASAGQVYALHFFNINATPVYVRLYNMTTTPGTGDTVVYRAIIPGNTAGAGCVVTLPPGVAFGTGIGIRVTGAIADNDNTSLAANTVMGNVFYK